MMSDYNVETINDGLNEFNVEFHGPKESIVFFSCAFTLYQCFLSFVPMDMNMICTSVSGSVHTHSLAHCALRLNL